jgi:hypothetical protein
MVAGVANSSADATGENANRAVKNMEVTAIYLPINTLSGHNVPTLMDEIPIDVTSISCYEV